METELTGSMIAWAALATVLFGAFGGVLYDLTEPRIGRRRREPEPAASDELVFGDNRLVVPRLSRRGQQRHFDAGFLGPVLVGVAAALVTVAVLVVERPEETSTVEREALVQTLRSEDVAASTVTAVERILDEPRKAFVQWEWLAAASLIAGFAGVGVLRIARSRLLEAVGAVAFQARVAGIREGQAEAVDAVSEVAASESIDEVKPEAQPVLLNAIEKAVDEHVLLLSASSPHGDPGFS